MNKLFLRYNTAERYILISIFNVLTEEMLLMGYIRIKRAKGLSYVNAIWSFCFTNMNFFAKHFFALVFLRHIQITLWAFPFFLTCNIINSTSTTVLATLVVFFFSEFYKYFMKTDKTTNVAKASETVMLFYSILMLCVVQNRRSDFYQI